MTQSAPRESCVEVAPGVRLHYVDWPGAEPAFLCLHGLTGNGRIWDALAERLSPGRRVIAVDLRGRGQSDKPAAGGYGLRTHATDMAALVRALGLGPVVLVGHSMGAFIAALLAAEEPELVDRLVLIDGGGIGGDMSEESIRAQIKNSLDRLRAVFPSFEAYLGYWRQVPFVQPWSAHFERFLAADVIEQPDGSVVCRAAPVAIEEDITKNVHEYDMMQVLPAVKAPAVVLWAPVGLLDPEQPLLPRAVVEQVAELLPNGQLVGVAGANHYTILLTPACLNQVQAAILGA